MRGDPVTPETDIYTLRVDVRRARSIRRCGFT